MVNMGKRWEGLKSYLKNVFFLTIEEGYRIPDDSAIRYILRGKDNVAENLLKRKENGEIDNLIVYEHAIIEATNLINTCENPQGALRRMERFTKNVRQERSPVYRPDITIGASKNTS